MGMDGYIEQIFKELPFGVAIAMVIFLAIFFIIWFLLPLWILFIKWDTGKIRNEIQRMADLLEKKGFEERKRNDSRAKD